MNQSTKQNPIIIDIVSDIVCPWCWLGKQYVDAAIAQSDQKNIRINWRPFMLDAGIPEKGLPYKAYLEKKFGKGGADRFKPMRTALEKRAIEMGIEFKFDEIQVRPNTLKAHLLMKWAAGQDKAHTVSEALFRAFFYELKDIGDIFTLSKIANSIGMDGALVTDLLKAKRDVNEVGEELAYFQKLGVSSVPTFIYNGTFAISGGQPAQAHLDALTKAASITPKNILTVFET